MTKTPGRISSRIALFALALAAPASAQCVGDIFADGQVNGADLGILLAQWGPASANTVSDLDSNGSVDGADLGVLLSDWGRCPAPSWATVIEADPDPAVVTDPALRAAIEATGLPWRVRDTATQIEMLLVPPGQFTMGKSAGDFQALANEVPAHPVTVTQAYYLGRYEVTQAQWQAKMGSNPSAWQGENHPVDLVSWNTTQGFCSVTGMRLPTEAEWEYAYRAGTSTAFHAMPGYPNGTNDPNLSGLIAWHRDNTCSGGSGCGTRDVGLKAANALGLHDMAGNVWEWVNDWYGNYPASAQTDPTGPANGTYRVVRGGSWNDFSYSVRSSYRYNPLPGDAYINIGFRVARTP